MLVVKISQTNLSFIVPTPAVDCSQSRSCNAVMLPACNFNNVVALVRIEFFYLSWHRCVELITDTELTMVVESPSEDLVLVIDVETVHFSAKYIDGVLCA